MNISKENEKSIIDEVYEYNRERYELKLDKENKGNRPLSRINDALDGIQSCCKEEITKETKDIIKEYCRRLDQAVSEEIEFSQKSFYKLGFIDGIRMIKDINGDIGAQFRL